MSADNGIYILVTPKGNHGACEYRVSEFQAVENLYYNPITYAELDWNNAAAIMHNARRMWGKCNVLTDKMAALCVAAEILDGLAICEYGISFINLDWEF